MGTRGIVGFVVGGKQFLTYNHYDSYPDGLGKDTFEWLVKHLVKAEDGTVRLNAEVLGVLNSLELVEEGADPTPEQIAKLKARGFDKPEAVSNQHDFYSWLRTCQGDLDATIRSGFWIKGGEKFALDSLFCEWGYVIDVDAGTFDAYEGFQSEPPTEGLWVGQRLPLEQEFTRDDGSTYTLRNDYEPIQRIVSVPFADLLEKWDGDGDEFAVYITSKSNDADEAVDA